MSLLLAIICVSGVSFSYAQSFTLHNNLFSPPYGYYGNGVNDWLSLGDYNSDGRLDMYNQLSLYQQTAQGRFQDVGYHSGFYYDAPPSPPPHDGSVGATWGDANGDGLLELLHFSYADGEVEEGEGGSVSELYLNQDGHNFKAVFSPLFIRIFTGINGAVWRDFNGDGHLDVLAAGNLHFLFSGNAEYVYQDVTADWGPDLEPGSCGLAVSDMDRDGDPDVFNSGCSSQVLFRNDIAETGGFTDISLASGIESLSNAGSAVWADINNDGWPDLFVAYTGQDKLYINQQNGQFVESAEAAGLGKTQLQSTFSVLAADFNNDGWVDFLLNRSKRIRFYVNDGDGTFTLESIPDVETSLLNPGMAYGDVNNDGWLDVVLRNPTGNRILVNDGGADNWLGVRLRGMDGNFYGVGATVRIHSDGVEQMRDITAGSGTRSQNDEMTAHFGLGEASLVERIMVEWPDGSREEVLDVEGGRVVTVVKGQGLNTPPERFEQILPQPGAFIEPGIVTIPFDWQDSVDPDDDLEYTVTIKGRSSFANQNLTVVDGLRESRLDFDASSLEPNLIYNWWVTASDGHSFISTGPPRSFVYGQPIGPQDYIVDPKSAGFPIGVALGDVRILDINTDGYDDILVSGTSESEVHVLLAALGKPSDYSGAWNPGILAYASSILAPGDPDGDGDPDLVVTGTLPTSSRVLLDFYDNDAGAWTRSPMSEDLTPVWGGGGLWLDLNGDGTDDLILSGSPTVEISTPVTHIYLVEPATTSSSSYRFAPITSTLPGMIFGDMDAVDVDGDGDLDVAMTGDSGNGVYFTGVYLNDGNGHFEELPTKLPPVSHSSVDWGDFDGDGDQDLLVSGGALGPETHRAVTTIFENKGVEGFQPYPAPILPVLAGQARWLDYDVDGDLDIVTNGSHTIHARPQLQILLNEPGGFVPVFIIPGTRLSKLAVVDIDADGDPDIVTNGFEFPHDPLTPIFINRTYDPDFPADR